LKGALDEAIIEHKKVEISGIQKVDEIPFDFYPETCLYSFFAKETDYVMAGHAMGAGNWRIILRHIVPNCFHPSWSW
jgi:hypothetical protein